MYKSVEEIENVIKNFAQVQLAYFEKVVKVNIPEITNAQSILDMLRDSDKHEAARHTDKYSLMFLFQLAYHGGTLLLEPQYIQLCNAMEAENQALRSLIHG